jgi:hypothetical protein
MGTLVGHGMKKFGIWLLGVFALGLAYQWLKHSVNEVFLLAGGKLLGAPSVRR